MSKTQFTLYTEKRFCWTSLFLYIYFILIKSFSTRVSLICIKRFIYTQNSCLFCLPSLLKMKKKTLWNFKSPACGLTAWRNLFSSKYLLNQANWLRVCYFHHHTPLSGYYLLFRRLQFNYIVFVCFFLCFFSLEFSGFLRPKFFFRFSTINIQINCLDFE